MRISEVTHSFLRRVLSKTSVKQKKVSSEKISAVKDVYFEGMSLSQMRHKEMVYVEEKIDNLRVVQKMLLSASLRELTLESEAMVLNDPKLQEIMDEIELRQLILREQLSKN